MIKSHRILLATCFFTSLLTFNAFAEAPVVDESENYAMLDEQQAAIEQPVAREQNNRYDTDDEPALANESTLQTSSQGDNAQLLDKLQGLQQEIQELRGQLEVQGHDLKLLKEQQLAFYKDLDARISHEGTPAANKTAKNEPAPSIAIDSQTPVAPKTALPQTKSKPIIQPVASSARTNPADEQIRYLAAYELVKNKQYDNAITAMQAFVDHYPQGGYTANAQYWLGELYLVKQDYSQSIEHFEAVLQQFPSSTKSAASMLKIGYAFAASGNTNEAKKRLQQVMKNYPDTNTAHLAAAKLESLDS